MNLSYSTIDDDQTVYPERLLIPIAYPSQADRLLPLARALRTAGFIKQLVFAGCVSVEPGHPLSRATAQARQCRQTLLALATEYSDLAPLIEPRVRVSHDLAGDLARLLQKYECDTVLVDVSQDGQHQVLGQPVHRLIEQLASRIIFQYGDIPEHPSRIVLASRGGEQAAHAIQVAVALGEATNSQVDVVQAVPGYESSAIRPELLRRHPSAHMIRLRGSLADLIDELSAQLVDADLLVLGAGASVGTTRPLGMRTQAILSAIERPAVVVYTPRRLTLLPVQIEPPSLSLRVDKWFAENTFDADEFADLDWLVDMKQAQGITISLGLPALNEAKTIGKIITAVRDTLMTRHSLLDEIVVIDSNSTDHTVEIAHELGIPVFRHSEILPELGSYVGKGEALWKSQYVLHGDIIVWIDTDIVNIHPRFVYGLLGPLLVSPQVQYVKGFYRRPLRVGDKLQAGGGGRVTELVARPMFNLFFPELSGIIQPLSGEYAGRRAALERLPFFSGYAVETGLLIDLLGQFDLPAIAQVDLKERIHHNQSLSALSKMSHVIIQAFFERLSDRQIITLLGEPSRSMKLIRNDDGPLYLDIEELSNIERPPMITVPEYRRRRGNRAQYDASLSGSPAPTDGERAL